MLRVIAPLALAAAGLCAAPAAQATPLGAAVFSAKADFGIDKAADTFAMIDFDFMSDLPAAPAHYTLDVSAVLTDATFFFPAGGPVPSIDALALLADPALIDLTLDGGPPFAAADLPVAVPELAFLIDLIAEGIALGSLSGDFDLDGLDASGSFFFDVGSTLTDFSGGASISVPTDADVEAGVADLLSEVFESPALPGLLGSYSSFTAGVDIDITLTAMAPIPLPAGALLLPGAIGALVLMRRRRKPAARDIAG